MPGFGVLIGVVLVALVAELGEHDEHPVGGLPAQFDVLGSGALRAVEFDDGAGAALLRLRPAGEHLLDGFLAQFATFGVERTGEIVMCLRDLRRAAVRGGRRSVCRRGPECRDRCGRQCGDRQSGDDLSHSSLL